jgi:hypothetical protein
MYFKLIILVVSLCAGNAINAMQPQPIINAIDEMLSATESLRTDYVERVKFTYALDPTSEQIDQVYSNASMTDFKWPKTFGEIFNKYDVEIVLRNKIIGAVNKKREALDNADTPTIEDARKAWQDFFDEVRDKLLSIKKNYSTSKDSKTNDDTAKEMEKCKRIAERIFESVINKKTNQELSDAENAFIENYEIDLKRPIKSIYFAGAVHDDDGNEIDKNVVGVTYFENPDLSTDNLERIGGNDAEFFTESIAGGFGGKSYRCYTSITYDIKKPKPAPIVKPAAKSAKANTLSPPKKPSPYLPYSNYSQGPGQAQVNKRVIQFSADEVLVDNVIYSLADANRLFGLGLKPLGLNLNITFQ